MLFLLGRFGRFIIGSRLRGLIGGLAGALLVTQLQEEPSFRVSQVPPTGDDSSRIAEILERLDTRQAEIDHRLSRIEERGPPTAPTLTSGSPTEVPAPASVAQTPAVSTVSRPVDSVPVRRESVAPSMSPTERARSLDDLARDMELMYAEKLTR